VTSILRLQDRQIRDPAGAKRERYSDDGPAAVY